MKISQILCLLCIQVIVPTMAYTQVVLHGHVLEYLGYSDKRPLAGVEIYIKDAGSTISDKYGSYSLTFRTSKKGDPVFVKRIEKINYEIFNTDAIQQWIIGSDFTIVMCSKARFKALRDSYYKVSSRSYANQYKNEKKNIEKLRKSKKITEEEYRQKIDQIRNDYQNQLENLETYVERFARIDLSEISDSEKKIVGLIHEGKIDKAIEEYEKQNYLQKYKQQIIEIQKIDSTLITIDELIQYKTMSRDSLCRLVDKQIELYRKMGGNENYIKIGQLLKKAADADITNYTIVMRYASYAEKNGNIGDAVKYYKLALPHIKDNDIIHFLEMKLKHFE